MTCPVMGVFLREILSSKGFGYKTAANMTIKCSQYDETYLGNQLLKISQFVTGNFKLPVTTGGHFYIAVDSGVSRVEATAMGFDSEYK